MTLNVKNGQNNKISAKWCWCINSDDAKEICIWQTRTREHFRLQNPPIVLWGVDGKERSKIGPLSPSTDLEVGALTQNVIADVQVVVSCWRLTGFTLGLSLRRRRTQLTGLGERLEVVGRHRPEVKVGFVAKQPVGWAQRPVSWGLFPAGLLARHCCCSATAGWLMTSSNASFSPHSTLSSLHALCLLLTRRLWQKAVARLPFSRCQQYEKLGLLSVSAWLQDFAPPRPAVAGSLLVNCAF